MAKNIKINHIETLFSAVVIRNAEEMIRRNREREAELFKSYNPLTGENAPGKRKRICLDDFVNSSVFLPVEMFSTGFIYKLNLAGSIEAVSYTHLDVYKRQDCKKRTARSLSGRSR